jgi:magnesium transporter
VIKHYHFHQKDVQITEDFKPIDGYKHYIQVVGLSNVQEIESLKTYYPVDNIILEDIFNVNQRDKLEMNKDYLFGVFHVNYLKDDMIIDDYMSLLLFKDTLISFHESKPVYLDVMHDLIHHYQELKETSIDFVFYQILDLITDKHLDLYETI